MTTASSCQFIVAERCRCGLCHSSPVSEEALQAWRATLSSSKPPAPHSLATSDSLEKLDAAVLVLKAEFLKLKGYVADHFAAVAERHVSDDVDAESEPIVVSRATSLEVAEAPSVEGRVREARDVTVPAVHSSFRVLNAVQSMQPPCRLDLCGVLTRFG